MTDIQMAGALGAALEPAQAKRQDGRSLALLLGVCKDGVLHYMVVV